MDSFFADVCHRHDDQRLDQFAMNQALGSFVHAPLHARKRSCCIEDILAIVQIEHRITSARKTSIAARQINQNVAPIPENFREKRAVPFDVSSQRMFAHQIEMLR